MSYSFTVRAASKEEAISKVAAELDKVVELQAVHAADREQAQTAAEAFIAVVPDPKDDQDLSVSVSGSLTSTVAGVVGGSISVSAEVVAKK